MKTEIEQQIGEIIAILGSNPEGLTRGQISDKLTFAIHNKTLQRRLAALAEEGRIVKEGEKKATRYFPAQVSLETDKRHLRDNSANIFTLESQKTLEFLEVPLHTRERVSYNRKFLDSYIPNQTTYTRDH